MSEAPDKPIVLVVEDDAVTRHAAIAMIEDAGFAVCAVDNGNAAIRLLDDGADVRVVVTDIDMPLGIDGIKLAACIHRRWPGIGIVIASGKVQPRPGDVPAEGRFLRKPYTEDQVVGAIRALIEPPGGPFQGPSQG